MKNFGLIVLLGLISFSCSKSLWVDKEPNIDVRQFKTYSWNTNEEAKMVSYYNQTEIDNKIRLEVEKSLKKLGYVKKNEGNVDFFINYNIYLKEDFFQEAVCPTGFYGNLGYSPDMNSSPRCDVEMEIFDFDSGNLVIDVMDTRTGQLVWRGTTVNIIENPKYAPEIFSQRIYRLLKKMEGPL
jgi:hypothetical protein